MEIKVGTKLRKGQRVFTVTGIEVTIGSKIMRGPIVNVELVESDGFESRYGLETIDSEFRSGLITEVVEPDLQELPPAGLDREALLELAYQAADGKTQWYNGETLVLSEDACLSNAGEEVWIYQVDGIGTARRVAKAFILDPLQGWVRVEKQPLTAKQAFEELFDL